MRMMLDGTSVAVAVATLELAVTFIQSLALLIIYEIHSLLTQTQTALYHPVHTVTIHTTYLHTCCCYHSVNNYNIYSTCKTVYFDLKAQSHQLWFFTGKVLILSLLSPFLLITFEGWKPLMQCNQQTQKVYAKINRWTNARSHAQLQFDLRVRLWHV